MKFSEVQLLQQFPFEATNPVLIDVGAHHGAMTIPFAERGWEVIAFEPEKVNFEAFQLNTRRFNNVHCFDFAVTDVSGNHVPFYVSTEHYGIHSLKPFHKTHVLAYEVETITLNDALHLQQINQVSFLKIDTEGADFLALKGLDLAKFSPELIMVEFMDQRSMKSYGYTHHDMVNYMEARGYCAFVSEWAPIQEYGREGESAEPHTWIQCVRYNINDSPNWGNIVFVPYKSESVFEKTLSLYINSLQRSEKRDSLIKHFKEEVKKLPGVLALYRFIRKKIAE